MSTGGRPSSRVKHATVQEAGRLGGLKLLHNRGRRHFIEIGKTGQQAMRRKYPGMASEWGKRGGRPRKLALSQYLGEAKK
jgi:general stress protein YciG